MYKILIVTINIKPFNRLEEKKQYVLFFVLEV